MNALAVICIGNRYAVEDAVGCEVFDRLSGETTSDVDIIDGGLCGLNLLREIEGRRRVVFVDALSGIGEAGEIVVLDRDAVAAYAGDYGHAAGLPYLLHMLPQVCDGPVPDIALVGASGRLDETALQALARRSLEVARHGTD